MGGAIFNLAGTVSVVNCTCTDNSAVGGAEGGGDNAKSTGYDGSGLGGAIFSLDGSLTVTNSTISGNTV